MKELEERIFTYDEIRKLFNEKGYSEMNKLLINLVAGYHKTIVNKAVCSQNIVTLRTFLKERKHV